MEGQIQITVRPRDGEPPEFDSNISLLGSLNEQAEALAVLLASTHGLVRNYVDAIATSDGPDVARAFALAVQAQFRTFSTQVDSGEAETRSAFNVREV